MTVAVIDTGIDYTHPELPLGTKTINLYDAIDHDGDAQDGYGHGTPVAGIIAGLQSGVARGAKVAAVRVLDNRGEGTDAQVIEGLDAVLSSVAAGNPHGIRVVNMSLGGYFDDTKPPEPGQLRRAGSRLQGRLRPPLAGGRPRRRGERQRRLHERHRPARLRQQRSRRRRGLRRGGQLPVLRGETVPPERVQRRHSRRGPDRLLLRLERPPRRPRPVALRAGARRGGGYDPCFGGTSGAAPYASGVAALLFGAEPLRGPTEVKAAMRSTGTPITDPRNGVTRNRLDAPAALASLRSAPQGSARAELLVPVVLDVTGVGGARFVSELTLTNRGTTAARLEATYTAATGMFPWPAGAARSSIPSPRASSVSSPMPSPGSVSTKGLPIPAGSGQAGTLRLVFTGLSLPETGLGAREDDRRLLQRRGGTLVSRLDRRGRRPRRA